MFATSVTNSSFPSANGRASFKQRNLSIAQGTWQLKKTSMVPYGLSIRPRLLEGAKLGLRNRCADKPTVEGVDYVLTAGTRFSLKFIQSSTGVTWSIKVIISDMSSWHLTRRATERTAAVQVLTHFLILDFSCSKTGMRKRWPIDPCSIPCSKSRQ